MIMKEDGNMLFDNSGDWDFEKFTTIICYLQAYYDAYLTDKPEFFNTGGQLCRIPVTQDLLSRMDIEESLEEFYGEAEVMQQEMLLDEEEEPLLRVIREATGLTLMLDPVLLNAIAVLPDMEEDIEDGFESTVWFG